MRKDLQSISDQYQEIQEYIIRSYEQFSKLLERPIEEQDEYDRKLKVAIEIYHNIRKQFDEISNTLSPSEVIEGYEEGSEILRRNLTGYMYAYFDEAYIPVMIKAINDDISEGTRFFILKLSTHLDRDQFLPVVLKALDSKYWHTRENALSCLQTLSLHEALPKVREMINDKNAQVAEYAAELVKKFEVD